MSEKESVEIRLHPLVVINISDHWTRAKVSNGGVETKVLGALIGKQVGRTISIYSSYEVALLQSSGGGDGELNVDWDYLKVKGNELKKVLPDYEFLGWYGTGALNIGCDLSLYKQVVALDLNENPLYLTLETDVGFNASKLPIQVYEAELRVVDDVPQFEFVARKYQIETEESERVAVDEIARVNVGSGDAGSKLSAHLTSLRNAINMLNLRVDVLVAYLDAVQRGEIEADQAILRQVSALCAQLPTVDSDDFRRDFFADYNDALLVTLLASVTKGAAALDSLANKYGRAYFSASPESSLPASMIMGGGGRGHHGGRGPGSRMHRGQRRHHRRQFTDIM
jgi:COP9 signalosome complex subunit 6